MTVLLSISISALIYFSTLVLKTKVELASSSIESLLITNYIIKAHIDTIIYKETHLFRKSILLKYDIPLAILSETISEYEFYSKDCKNLFEYINNRDFREYYKELLIEQDY